MPNLVHNSIPSIGSLRTYLLRILPSSIMTEVEIDSANQPILLMQTKHLIAAFAFSTSDIHSSYSVLYSGFKNFYVQQEGNWDNLDLSFVFCLQHEIPDLDNFCSKVETDVYFCRKFVVLLDDSLGSSLARLPFLPLTPLSGQSMRPASAQTFLQKCAVPAMLAKNIVVQRERSPDGIVEDVTSGKFGEPRELAHVPNTKVVQPDRDTDYVRLESVTIKNFRAYRKPQTFEIGSNVTVLYGPNGFGKTSFFDAVDFAVTGGIERFESSSEAPFAKAVRHLDCNTEESVVKLSFLRNGAVRNIARSVSDRKQALLDDQPTDRKSILTELTSGNIPAADRVENFVNLFRATHLFSQEQQELTKDFRTDCRLSVEIVSRMLAFEDYVSAVNKTAKVCDVLEAEISNANKEVEELSSQITEEQVELDRLGQTSKIHSNMESLETVIEALSDKIAMTGIAVSTQKPDAAALRGWRAILESRHTECQSKIDQLNILTKDVARLQQMKADSTQFQQQLSEKEIALGEAEEKRIAAELSHLIEEKIIATKNVLCSDKQAYATLIEWVRSTKPVYTQLVEKQRSLKEELAQSTETLKKYRAEEEKEAAELHAKKCITELASEKLQTKRNALAMVKRLNDSISNWQANRSQLDAIIESELLVVKDLELLRAEARELCEQTNAIAAEEARVTRQIAEVDNNQSELKNLLSQMQGHVRSGTCPLCGEDHGSKDELIRRIQRHLEIDAASGARIELSVILEQTSKLAERVAENRQKQCAGDNQLSGLRKEKARIDLEIRPLEDSAMALGVTFGKTDQTPVEQLQVMLSRIEQEIEELSQQVQEAESAEGVARTALSKTKSLIAVNVAAKAEKTEILEHLQKELNILCNDPRLTDLSLHIDDIQLLEYENSNRMELATLKAEIAKSQTVVSNLKTEIASYQQESASLKPQITAIRSNIVSLKNATAQITARFEQSKLPEDVNEKTLLSMIEEHSRDQARFLMLSDSVSNLELAIDTATTSAALTQLLQNIKSKELAIKAAKKRRDLHQPWLKYFESLSRLLSTHQNDAISNFTREFGPLTSIIQRRLRSIYGFDDIEIRSRESMISVRVKRHGEELRPTDYFSQSQQQTLLLGLFLTACSSQTWSAFSTVFLDDPVTHFDDLNTYALLDLIVGLLESDFGKRQFIISTCDEKLLQLARQKFRHLGDGAKFYRFTSIGADGPRIDQII
jgi:exonuclease SbcC